VRVAVRVAVAVRVGVDVREGVRVEVGGTGVDVRVGVRVEVEGTGVDVRVGVRVIVGVCVGVEAPTTVTVAPPAAPGMDVGPTGGGPGWNAETRLDGDAMSDALPAPIVVKERTATVTLPVGVESEV
jgi:hypothetical protein